MTTNFPYNLNMTRDHQTKKDCDDNLEYQKRNESNFPENTKDIKCEKFFAISDSEKEANFHNTTEQYNQENASTVTDYNTDFETAESFNPYIKYYRAMTDPETEEPNPVSASNETVSHSIIENETSQYRGHDLQKQTSANFDTRNYLEPTQQRNIQSLKPYYHQTDKFANSTYQGFFSGINQYKEIDPYKNNGLSNTYKSELQPKRDRNKYMFGEEKDYRNSQNENFRSINRPSFDPENSNQQELHHQRNIISNNIKNFESILNRNTLPQLFSEFKATIPSKQKKEFDRKYSNLSDFVSNFNEYNQRKRKNSMYKYTAEEKKNLHSSCELRRRTVINAGLNSLADLLDADMPTRKNKKKIIIDALRKILGMKIYIQKNL